MSPPDYSFEEKLWKAGKLPAGVDEAGRGPLAGPVVAAAIILPKECTLNTLDDSKKLTPEKRVIILEQIKELAISTSVGIIDSHLIDKINILRAAILAMEKAVKHLEKAPDFLLIDGNIRISIPIPQEPIVKGDSKCCSIAAASILAKVTRDKIMNNYHSLYPEYNFSKHKGYPTKEHLEAIRRFGPSPIHRKTFRGVLKF
ncbi:MAG: ribonuclease HII [Thermodesulfobacteriota bacterium]